MFYFVVIQKFKTNKWKQNKNGKSILCAANGTARIRSFEIYSHRQIQRWGEFISFDSSRGPEISYQHPGPATPIICNLSSWVSDVFSGLCEYPHTCSKHIYGHTNTPCKNLNALQPPQYRFGFSFIHVFAFNGKTISTKLYIPKHF